MDRHFLSLPKYCLMFRFLILLIIFTGLQQLHAQQFQRSSGKKKQQSQECGLMIVDLNNGTVHGLNPVSSIEDIKSKLPCFTSEIEEGSDERCGGGIFYENRSIDFFTGLDCISIRTKFGGTITYKRRPVQLLGATSAQVSEIIKKKPEMVKPAGKRICNPQFTGCLMVCWSSIIFLTMSWRSTSATKSYPR